MEGLIQVIVPFKYSSRTYDVWDTVKGITATSIQVTNHNIHITNNQMYEFILQACETIGSFNIVEAESANIRLSCYKEHSVCCVSRMDWVGPKSILRGWLGGWWWPWLGVRWKPRRWIFEIIEGRLYKTWLLGNWLAVWLQREGRVSWMNEWIADFHLTRLPRKNWKRKGDETL